MPQAATRPDWILSPAPAGGGKMPWRKVHLDFHNSEHIRSIGEGFDRSEFRDTVKAARVDSIVVFAKDMHGYCYYPSEKGPVHPGLKCDLLGEQVAACREEGIAVYAYYCTLWDHYLAFNCPQWLSVRRNGETYMPPEGAPPGWTALCASNYFLVEHMKVHVNEILSAYDVDGIWFDMPYPRDAECFCPNCVSSIQRKGGDPYDVPTQRRHQQELHQAFLEAMYDASQQAKPGCQVDFNNQPAFGLGERIRWMESIDIEALPTAEWGYDFFPTVARYVRTFPRTMYGMTGRFLKSWGDFGGLKTGNQLAAECFGILSVGAKCDIGDQMPPAGRLDAAVYKSIGAAYAEVEKLESHLDGARTVAEGALVVSGLPLDTIATPTVCGLSKAMAELNIQFDVLEMSQDWQRYPIAVFPSLDAGSLSAVRDYVGMGGKAVVVDGTAFGEIGAEKSPFLPSYAVITGEYEFAIYGEAWSWTPKGDALAHYGVPEFQRSGEHYTSHAQTPFERVDHDLSVAEVRDGIGWIGFDLGKLYAETGYEFYRRLLQSVLNSLKFKQMANSSYPGTIQVNLMSKPESGEWLVHVLDTRVSRPSPGHPPYYEEAPPSADVDLTLRLESAQWQAKGLRSGETFPVSCAHGKAKLRIPRLSRYEVILLSPMRGAH